MLKSFRHLSVLLVATAAAVVQTSRSCDLCGCYTPQVEALPQSADESPFGQPAANGSQGHWYNRAYFAVAEQFTHFGTVQIDGREVSNPSGQYEDSSITQLVAGTSFTPRFALQINIPLIYRAYERPEGFKTDRGTESGLGDVSLLGKCVVFRKESGGGLALAFDDPKNPRMVTSEPDFTASTLLVGGLKLPTGDSSRLTEEFHEVEMPGAPVSGIHGHDLTLGTGSCDALIGGQTSARYHSFFFEADTQFTLRGDGLHDYHFANDLSWSGGPGWYFVRGRKVIVGIQCVCSGEHKDVDRYRGKAADDTGVTSVFLGPRVVASVGRISADLAAELPVSINNTALQVVPDYRLRASVAIGF